MKIGNLFKSYMNYAQGKHNNTLFNAILTPLTYIANAYLSSLNFMMQHGLLKTEESPLPLISVGNLTYGGTNKTPFVEMLAKFSHSKGIRAGIVTRGYSGRSHAPVSIILDGNGQRDITGDEPLMLSRNLPGVPVAVARQRIDAVKALREMGMELAIADDAFQHRALGRDADIVLIDCMCPFGNGKITPAGVLRENISALSRADIVVLTKAEQASETDIAALRETVKRYVEPARIFTSRLEHDGYITFGVDAPERGAKVFAFSAIGNPESFMLLLEEQGFTVTGNKTYTDHHRYTCKDLKELCGLADKSGADMMICTEKDLYNLPEKDAWPFTLPLVIPKVKAVLNEPEEFFGALRECLKPKVVVASNGYGEDAIGVMLAKKLRDRLSRSEIYAFPLVGKGDAYTQAGFTVKSAPSVTPSGGVVKYSVRDLLGDMRAGLLRHISSQLRDWRKIASKIRTPVCVGDVYLLLHTLWGSGARPMFCATAKTVYLSGHWRSEKAIINAFTLRTWTRDAKSAEQLGGHAVYAGSPVMDLLYDDGGKVHGYVHGDVILLLPGSRLRACKDVKLLLDTVLLLGKHDYRMVLAPTLPLEEFMTACKSYGWDVESGRLARDGIVIELTHENIARAAQGVKILLGLGGTANQLCAGLGIPVISIDEKGKRVQKKLLGESEILTEAKPEALAESVLRVLGDKALYEAMSAAGRERMGQPGALDDIVNYACDALGWDIRERVYMKLGE